MADKATAAGGGNGDALREDLDALREDVRKLVNDAQAAAKSKAADLAEGARAAASDAKDWANAETKAAARLVQEKPVAALAIAAGIGAVIGLLLARR